MKINGYNVVIHGEVDNFSWEHVYTYLKAVNGQTTIEELLTHFMNIDLEVLREGIEEYDDMAKVSGGHFAPLNIN